jgi:hypothetical protein
MPSNTICDLVILLGLKKSEINAVRWDFIIIIFIREGYIREAIHKEYEGSLEVGEFLCKNNFI